MGRQGITSLGVAAGSCKSVSCAPAPTIITTAPPRVASGPPAESSSRWRHWPQPSCWFAAACSSRSWGRSSIRRYTTSSRSSSVSRGSCRCWCGSSARATTPSRSSRWCSAAYWVRSWWRLVPCGSSGCQGISCPNSTGAGRRPATGCSSGQRPPEAMPRRGRPEPKTIRGFSGPPAPAASTVRRLILTG